MRIEHNCKIFDRGSEKKRGTTTQKKRMSLIHPGGLVR